MAIITINMRKNDGLEKKKKKKFFFFLVFSHPGGSVPLPGVQESGRISGRLPDDPGGFTCMCVSCKVKGHHVNFAWDLLHSYYGECQKNEIHLLYLHCVFTSFLFIICKVLL